jgi:HPt (histidine-containing phosphotransfer) domain-containing protein
MSMDPQGPEVLDPQLLDTLRALQEPGDPDLAHELITLFLRDSGVRLARTRDAVSRGDLPAVAELAHQMKGSAGAVSASRLGDSSAALEQAARRGSPDAATLAALLERLLRDFDDVRAAFARLGFDS